METQAVKSICELLKYHKIWNISEFDDLPDRPPFRHVCILEYKDIKIDYRCGFGCFGPKISLFINEQKINNLSNRSLNKLYKSTRKCLADYFENLKKEKLSQLVGF